MELEIGKKIAIYRKAKGYTQEQLGEMVGVSGQAVSKWEKGGMPDTYLLPVIAKVLGVSIDALFDVERKITDYSEAEIQDDLFAFCLKKCHQKGSGFDLFAFLFETVWTIQCAYFGNESRYQLEDVIEKYQDNKEITSQIINNQGTTCFSLVKDFPFYCAVGESPEISKRILGEEDFSSFFSLLASKEGLQAVIFTQTTTESGQYTAETMAKKMGISPRRFMELEPILVKYDLLGEDSLTLDDTVVKVYRKWDNPRIRPLLMMAYQIINQRQCYYNFTNNRTKPYFEQE